MAQQVGIDLGSSSIKVVVGEMKGPLFILKRTFTLPVGSAAEPEEAILAAIGGLKESLEKAPGSRFSLSGKELIIRYTQVPPVPTWRLRLLMDLEVREMSGQAGETLASDYNLVSVPGKGGGDETVLVAVVKEPFLVARTTAVAESCGPPKAGMPSSIALFNSYIHSGALHEGEHVFLIDIGDRNTEIILQKDGELLFARNIAAGGGLLTDAVAQSFGVSREEAERLKQQFGNVTPKGMATYTTGKEEKVANAVIGPTGQLASMLQSSLAFSRAQTGIRDLKIGRILLSGGGSNLRGLPEYLQSSFGCTVERFQPESGLDLSPLDGEEAADFEKDPGRYAVALGLAVAGAKKESFLIDLVPEPVKKKREFVTRKLFLFAAAAMAMIFLVVRFVTLSSEKSKLADQARTAQLAATTAKKNGEKFDATRAELAQINQKLRVMDAVTEPNWALATVPRVVQELCPDGVWIESVEARRAPMKEESEDGKATPVLRTIVTIRGQIVSLDQQAETALEEMKTRIQQDRPTWTVRIQKQSGGASAGSKKLEFEIQVLPWPLTTKAAPEGGTP